MDKQQLTEHLQKKLQKQENTFIDAYLKSQEEPFYKGKTEYNSTQRFLVMHEIDKKDIMPEKTKTLRNVLLNIKQPNPSKLSNINDNGQFKIYQFLTKLQEPSKKYFKEGDDNSSVIEHLVITHDEYYPSEKNGFNWEVSHEGEGIYLGLKSGAIDDLKEAFVNRGLASLDYNKEHDSESISKTMTQSRYEYLIDLAKSFEENPESPEVIGFMKELPSNTWFDHTIHLICDNNKKFDALKKKHISNYKTIEETIKEIKK